MAAPPTDVDLSPFAVFVAVAGAAVGPVFAQYVGAYSFILLGWFAGLLYGLYTRTEARMPVWAYTLFTLTVALAVTVPTSKFVAEYVPFSYTALLFPVSAAIPAMPDKWGAIGNWLLKRWQAARGVRP